MLEALIHSKKEWLKNQSNTTKYMIGSKQKKLLSLLDYDVCISFLFNSNKNMALVEGIVGRKREYCKKKIPNTIFLNRSQYSSIRELMDKRSIIENCSQASLPLLLEGFRSEVYIPLFSCNDKNLSMELIGCLYLGSSNYKEFPLNYFLDDKLIKEIINDISKLLSLRFVRWVQLTDAVNMVVFLLGILESKVSHFSTHGYNVAGWCREIGMEVGLSKGELKELTLAALLHDVGKLMVDPKILRKEDELEEDEYHKVQEHVYYSYRILKHLFEHIEGLQNIPNIVKYHHERYDGKGYPYGLKGDEVPFKSYNFGPYKYFDLHYTNIPDSKKDAIYRQLFKKQIQLRKTMSEYKLV